MKLSDQCSDLVSPKRAMNYSLSESAEGCNAEQHIDAGNTIAVEGSIVGGCIPKEFNLSAD